MVDFILFVFVVAVFCAGFWAGKTYGSYQVMWANFTEWFNSLR